MRVVRGVDGKGMGMEGALGYVLVRGVRIRHIVIIFLHSWFRSVAFQVL
jgi:hypothetical protein